MLWLPPRDHNQQQHFTVIIINVSTGSCYSGESVMPDLISFVSSSEQTGAWRGAAGADCDQRRQQEAAEGDWGQDPAHSLRLRGQHPGGWECHPGAGLLQGPLRRDLQEAEGEVCRSVGTLLWVAIKSLRLHAQCERFDCHWFCLKAGGKPFKLPKFPAWEQCSYHSFPPETSCNTLTDSSRSSLEQLRDSMWLWLRVLVIYKL